MNDTINANVNVFALKIQFIHPSIRVTGHQKKAHFKVTVCMNKLNLHYTGLDISIEEVLWVQHIIPLYLI